MVDHSTVQPLEFLPIVIGSADQSAYTLLYFIYKVKETWSHGIKVHPTPQVHRRRETDLPLYTITDNHATRLSRIIEYVQGGLFNYKGRELPPPNLYFVNSTLVEEKTRTDTIRTFSSFPSS